MQAGRRTDAQDPSDNEQEPQGESPIERLLRTGGSGLRDAHARIVTTRPGRAWRLDPNVGDGVLWHFPITGEMAVACCRITLARRVEGAFLAPEHYCVGLYRQFPLDDSESTGAAREVVLGHAWKGQAFIATPNPDETLESTCIVLTARALQVMSLRCQCDPFVLSNAIALLDGSKEVPACARCSRTSRRLGLRRSWRGRSTRAKRPKPYRASWTGAFRARRRARPP